MLVFSSLYSEKTNFVVFPHFSFWDANYLKHLQNKMRFTSFSTWSITDGERYGFDWDSWYFLLIHFSIPAHLQHSSCCFNLNNRWLLSAYDLLQASDDITCFKDKLTVSHLLTSASLILWNLFSCRRILLSQG